MINECIGEATRCGRAELPSTSYCAQGTDWKKLIVLSSKLPENPRKYEGRIPGRIILIHQDGVEVLTGDSSIIISEVEYDGKIYNASEIVKSVKKTLGINWIELYENLNKLLNHNEN